MDGKPAVQITENYNPNNPLVTAFFPTETDKGDLYMKFEGEYKTEKGAVKVQLGLRCNNADCSDVKTTGLIHPWLNDIPMIELIGGIPGSQFILDRYNTAEQKYKECNR